MLSTLGFKKSHAPNALGRRRAHSAAGVLTRAVLVALVAGIPAIGIGAQQVGMSYPNIPGELLLENEYVVVQRFIIEPGQWEGFTPIRATTSGCSSREG